MASPAAASSTAASYSVRRLGVFDRGLFRMARLEAGVALGELLVELAGVEQDERGELDRPRGRVDLARVPGLHQQREEPAMVEMGVGQQDRVEGRRVVGERDPVPDRLVRTALEHPAVDEDAGAARLEQELRAGDGRRAAEEVDLHGCDGDSAHGRRAYPRRRCPCRSGCSRQAPRDRRLTSSARFSAVR